MKNLNLRSFLSLFFSLTLALNLSAQIPKLISYQGLLTDQNGKALADGTYQIDVNIFDIAQGGTALWTESHSINTVNGLFNVILGENTALDLPFDQAYYLATTVDGTELSPRTMMTASPYAINSDNSSAIKPYALDAFGDNEKDVVFVDTASNIGFGTSSPNVEFHFKGKDSLAQLFLEPGIFTSPGHEASLAFGDFNHSISGIWGNGMRFFDVDQFRFEGASATFERNVGIGGPPSWRFHAQGNAADFIVYSDFPELNGETIVAGFRSKIAPGSIVRFENGINSNFVDMGTNGDGHFVFEHNDRLDFIIANDGKVSVGTPTGNNNFLSQFQVNGPNGTAALLESSELKLLGPGTAHFSLINSQDGSLRIKNTSTLSEPGTGGPDLMTISENGNLQIARDLIMGQDGNIFQLDGLWGFNDLRFFGDPSGAENGPDLSINADGTVFVGNGALQVGPEADFFAKFSVKDDYRSFYVPTWDGGLATDSVLIAGVFQGEENVKPQLRFMDHTGSRFYDFGFDSDYRFVIETSGDAKHFILLPNGNFGLGVLDPSERLEVNGNILASGSITENSDRRFKKNFKIINNALTKVQQLSGLYYDWRVEDFPEKDFATDRQIGLIAQEVEALFPEMVITDAKGYKAVNYGRMTPVLIEAVKEQQNMIDQLKHEKAELEAKLEALQSSVLARLEALEQHAQGKNSTKANTGQ